jgi:hypothetical protein
MTKLIKVKGAAKGNRVALSERHPDHPNGEIFIYGQRSAWVAATRAVMTAIAHRVLELDHEDDPPIVEPSAEEGSGLAPADVVPEPEPEPAPESETTVSDRDNFSLVDGIGDRTTEALYELGIYTKRDLLTMGVGEGMSRVLSLPGMTKAKYNALLEWSTAA